MAVSVVIVEDERIIARHLRETLEQVGYTVAGIATTAIEALALCAEVRPAAVLMDIGLRNSTMDGIGIAEVLLAQYGLRVIYLTAGIDDLDKLERAKRTRPHAYLLKPVNVGELLGALAVALR